MRRNPHIQGTLDVYQAKLEGLYTRVQNVNEWNVRADVIARLTIGQKSMALLKKPGARWFRFKAAMYKVRSVFL